MSKPRACFRYSGIIREDKQGYKGRMSSHVNLLVVTEGELLSSEVLYISL